MSALAKAAENAKLQHANADRHQAEADRLSKDPKQARMAANYQRLADSARKNAKAFEAVHQRHEESKKGLASEVATSKDLAGKISAVEKASKGLKRANKAIKAGELTPKEMGKAIDSARAVKNWASRSGGGGDWDESKHPRDESGKFG